MQALVSFEKAAPMSSFEQVRHPLQLAPLHHHWNCCLPTLLVQERATASGAAVF